MGLSTPILIGPQILIGLVLGLLLGVFLPSIGLQLEFLSDLFLRLVKMVIVPLLVATLVSGLSAGGSFKKVERIALMAVLYFAVLTIVVFALGSAFGVLLQPGAVESSQEVSAVGTISAEPKPDLRDLLVKIVPNSVVEAMARNDILQVVVFSLFLGIAISRAGAAGENLARLFSDFARIMFLVTNWVMYFAPVGACAALAYSLAREGLEVLFSLIRLILVVYLAMLVLVLVVFPAIAFFFRISFSSLLRAVATPFFLAFSTCSSQTALPRALQNMEDFGVSKEVVSFVLPVGYSFNLVGSYTYQVLALFFLIQYYQFPLSSFEIMILLLALMVTSKGIATVPRASVLVLAGTPDGLRSSFGRDCVAFWRSTSSWTCHARAST